MKNRCLIVLTVLIGAFVGMSTCRGNEIAKNPIKVFIFAGDENVLEQGVIEGRTSGIHEEFYPNVKRRKGEKKKHVNCAVYKGAYLQKTDYKKVTPDATGIVEVGEQRTRRNANKRGRSPVPFTPFPELALKEGYVTVLQGYVSVKFSGKYEFLPGKDDSSYNVTTVEGKEVYRRDLTQVEPTLTPLQLEPKKRYAFKTVFFKKPGHAFRVPLVNKPGTLATAVAENPKYAFLKDKVGEWVKRSDVVLYDAHPIHNNTKAVGHFLQVGDVSYGGEKTINAMGPDLMFGHVLGNHFDEPVLILRFGTRHPIWFFRGSRTLGHDYRPPSSGGTKDHDGSWDVIHFNFGVWDAVYREPKSKFYKGRHTTSVEDFEKNLRTLVTRMKKTGATLIWGSVTPLYEGEPGKPYGDELKYNAVAAKVMKENDVIINDLYAESIRQGFPKTTNVHSVGNLAPKVTKAIADALASRKKSTKPLPRVLMIGDSITGSYINQVTKNFDGKAFICKNPGNGEDTWNGLEKIDQWLDLKRYLLNGQEYMELVDGVKYAMTQLDRAYPGYKGNGAELAGLVWFQGVADAKSEAYSASYEKNLANFIRDIRKGLEAPKLPVVVVGLATSKGTLSAKQKQVFDAQMAMGDKEKYPDFVGNVISVDTRGACRPSATSPGSRDNYNGNAESYLEIGDAMGQAMLNILNSSK